MRDDATLAVLKPRFCFVAIDNGVTKELAFNGTLPSFVFGTGGSAHSATAWCCPLPAIPNLIKR
jgi:hypothetical protein